MGTGVAKGQNRARLAAEMSIASPLLDDISVEGATWVLINIVGGPDLKMKEIQEAASLVQEQAHEDANIIFGASIDETLGENVKVTVIATGFDTQDREMAVEAQSHRPSMAPSMMSSAPQRSLGTSSGMRPSMDSAALSSRRPAPSQTMRAGEERRDGRAQAPSTLPRPQARTVTLQDAFPHLDNDWDVPAFQRKQR